MKTIVTDTYDFPTLIRNENVEFRGAPKNGGYYPTPAAHGKVV